MQCTSLLSMSMVNGDILESSIRPMQGTSVAFVPNMANYSTVKQTALAPRNVDREVDYVLFEIVEREMSDWPWRCLSTRMGRQSTIVPHDQCPPKKSH